MAKPIFIVRLPKDAPFEMANSVKEKTGRNLGDEYHVLVLIDMARKSKEIKFECYNADYSDMEWFELEERVNAILNYKQHHKIQLKLYGSHTTYINTYIRFNMQPTMTNEQFALWIATQMIHSNLFETGDAVYEWLENKRSNSGYDIFEAMEAKKLKTKDSEQIHTMVPN